LDNIFQSRIPLEFITSNTPVHKEPQTRRGRESTSKDFMREMRDPTLQATNSCGQGRETNSIW